jgi:hypothetical protein
MVPMPKVFYIKFNVIISQIQIEHHTLFQERIAVQINKLVRETLFDAVNI